MERGKIYIQQSIKGDWMNQNCFAIAEGCKGLGFEVVPFNVYEAHALPVQKNDVVYGGIYATLEAFKTLKVALPELINAHQLLPGFMGRKVWETTVGEIKHSSTAEYPCFMKPLKDNKLFNGLVVQKPLFAALKLKALADETEILVSEVVNFVTEYRCFVHNGSIVDVRYYKGNARKIIDFNVADQAVRALYKCPVAYTIDFGLTDTGSTQLIEINDGFGFGLYGLDFRKAIPMIFDRWDQIVGNQIQPS